MMKEGKHGNGYSREFKRSVVRGAGFATGLLVILALGTAAAITVDTITTSFTANTVVSSSVMQTNFTNIDSALKAIPVGSFCGSTTATYDGVTVGGYTGAKAKCVALCENSRAHMCTAAEIVLSAQNGTSIPANSWYSTGVQHIIGTSVQVGTDCLGWTDNTNTTTQGVIWNGSRPLASDCDTLNRIACCL